MQTDHVKFPSGAVIELRAMTVKDENMLASTRASRRNEAMDRLLGRCTESVVDPGPYKDLGEKPSWTDMLMGDRLWGLIALRKISYKDGDEFAFMTQCPECRKKFEWELNLSKDLYVQELPEDSAKRFKESVPFETTICGKLIKFRLSTGRDEARFSKLKDRHKGGRDSSLSMDIRIIDVEGVERRKVIDWLETLSTGEAEEIREAFDDVDCGVDTDIEVECVGCDLEYEVPLPFDRLFMLSRGARMKMKRRQAADQAADSDSDD
jgi:hypothetical protein